MGTWHLQDLTTEAAAPPTPAVKPAAYVFKAQGTQHVVYTDSHDGHAHELWWDTNDVAPDELAGVTAPGAYRYINAGQHTGWGRFPAREPKAFDPANTIDASNLRTLPDADKAPQYACNGCPSNTS